MRTMRRASLAFAGVMLLGAAVPASAGAKTVNFCGLVATTPAGCLVLRSSTGGRGYEIVGAHHRPPAGTIITGSGTLGGRSACRAMYNRLTLTNWHKVTACPT